MKLYIRSSTTEAIDLRSAIISILENEDRSYLEEYIGKPYDRIIEELVHSAEFWTKNRDWDTDNATVVTTDKWNKGMRQIIIDKVVHNPNWSDNPEDYSDELSQPQCTETNYRYKKRIKEDNEELNLDPEKKCQVAWDQFTYWLENDRSTGGREVAKILTRNDLKDIKNNLDNFVLSHNTGNIKRMKFWCNSNRGIIKAQLFTNQVATIFSSPELHHIRSNYY